jgi:hypothetical protein
LVGRLLDVSHTALVNRASDDAAHEDEDWNACPYYGRRMIIVETFER